MWGSQISKGIAVNTVRLIKIANTLFSETVYFVYHLNVLTTVTHNLLIQFMAHLSFNIHFKSPYTNVMMLD